MENNRSVRSNINALAKKLTKDGVVSVEGYLEEDVCREIRSSVKSLIESGDYESAHDMTGFEMRSASRTIINERTGDSDHGMIDIFNIDESIEEAKAVKTDNIIREIVNQAANNEYGPENINIYYNRSVSNTRSYHFDSYAPQFKAFVYLTDVPDETYGPYSYIKGSHRRSYPRRRVEGIVNRLRGRKPTAALFIDEINIETFTAPAGTLIISDQTGYHRGIPQAEGRERMLFSNSFTLQ